MVLQDRVFKILIISITAFLILLTLAWVDTSPAYADFPHGEYTSNSNNCATCHLTNGAKTEKLLRGNSETDFCYFCHGGSSESNGSGYDVENGLVRGGSGTNPSYAGGFVKSINPTVEGQVYSNTSMHNISGSNMDIPGGGKWTGTFSCGSCHDPHAGGSYPAASDEPYENPRLLRMQLLDDEENNITRAVYMKIDYADTKLPLSYGKGFNEWCGGCHNVFNTEGQERTGAVGVSSGESSMDKFRHKVGVYISDHNVFSTSLENGLPIPTDTVGSDIGVPGWRLNCLTCHRAHGTSVNVSVGFKRFTTYNSVYGYGADENQSALLRLPERAACYKCHGSAEYNLYQEEVPGIVKYESGW